MPGFKVGVDRPPFTGDCAGDLISFAASSFDTVPSNRVEVGRVHRWVFSALRPLQADSSSILTGKSESYLIYASKCTRPSVEIDEIKIHNGQNEIYRPGKHRWSPIEMTFYDIYSGGDSQNGLAVLNAGVAEKIYRWWSQVVVNTQSNTIPRDFYVDAKLHMLDGLGRKVWEYNLYDCWPIKVSPNDLDYSNTALSEISVTMRYNKAEEVKAPTN